ncbi:MAG: hypothetical protein IM613_17985 [Cytophagales bacterium]|nr:hypothetical protein [Cytophagales bacterium]
MHTNKPILRQRIKASLVLLLVIIISISSVDYLTYLDERSRSNLPFLVILGIVLGYYVCNPLIWLLRHYVRPSWIVFSILLCCTLSLYILRYNAPGPALTKWFFFALGNVYYLSISYVFRKQTH